MADRAKEEYELQRRLNLLLAQAPPAAQREPALLDELARVQAALDRLQQPGPTGSGGMLMGQDTTGLEVWVELGMVQVPTSFAHLLDATTPLVTYHVSNGRKAPARVKLVTQVIGYSSPAIDTVEIGAGQSEPVPHLPVFDHERIADIAESRAACLHVRVEDLDGQVERESTYRIVLLPRTTGYLSLRSASGAIVDLKPYLAAWVTPNAPAVMQLIREAAARHPRGVIAGYQLGGELDLDAVVTAQVAAIYAAIQAHEIVYVNSTAAFNLAGDAFVQRIRLPRESLATRSANCVDGVLLMASALEAASLDPAIVLVPGHALLAYDLSSGGHRWDYVETTMLGTSPFSEAQEAGRRTAQQLLSTGPDAIRILPVAELRTVRGIFPME